MEGSEEKSREAEKRKGKESKGKQRRVERSELLKSHDKRPRVTTRGPKRRGENTHTVRPDLPAQKSQECICLTYVSLLHTRLHGLQRHVAQSHIAHAITWLAATRKL
eukprot:1437500-Rhodomonas_salina.4